jgi:hypothetical protein
VRLEAVRTLAIEGRIDGAGDLAGFAVMVRPVGRPSEWVQQTQGKSDAQGRFKIDGVGPGPFMLVASKTKDDRYGLLASVRGGATNVVVGLETGASIEGTFEDAAGAAISQNAWVQASNDKWSGWGTLDAEGRFRVSGLPPGAYKVTGSRNTGGAPAVAENVQAGTTGLRLRAPGG